MKNLFKNWLQKHWRYDNHSKYQQYFDMWYSNLTDGQIKGFEHQMFNEENNILGKKYI